MTFAINLGQPESILRSKLPDWFLDQQPEDATDAQLAFTYGQWLTREALRP